MTKFFCPRCKSNKTYKSTECPFKPDDHTYRCKVCSCWFVPDDEGCGYDNNPTMRLQREEERARERRELLKLRQRKPR